MVPFGYGQGLLSTGRTELHQQAFCHISPASTGPRMLASLDSSPLSVVSILEAVIRAKSRSNISPIYTRFYFVQYHTDICLISLFLNLRFLSVMPSQRRKETYVSENSASTEYRDPRKSTQGSYLAQHFGELALLKSRQYFGRPTTMRLV